MRQFRGLVLLAVCCTCVSLRINNALRLLFFQFCVSCSLSVINFCNSVGRRSGSRSTKCFSHDENVVKAYLSYCLYINSSITFPTFQIMYPPIPTRSSLNFETFHRLYEESISQPELFWTKASDQHLSW